MFVLDGFAWSHLLCYPVTARTGNLGGLPGPYLDDLWTATCTRDAAQSSPRTFRDERKRNSARQRRRAAHATGAARTVGEIQLRREYAGRSVREVGAVGNVAVLVQARAPAVLASAPGRHSWCCDRANIARGDL